jgi:D-tyrosyl-tRNA(Tyr) deacylase
LKAVIQRVSSARVEVAGEVVGRIDAGFLVLLGCEVGDDDAAARKMASRIAKLRIFEDADGRTNLDIFAVGGEILLVSQFTLAADLRSGNRPSFTTAMAPEGARMLLDAVSQALSDKGLKVEHGVFGAAMSVHLCNVGPATYHLEL